MATKTASLAMRSSTDAEFRVWGKFISDTFGLANWSQIYSNINWATVTAPGAANTFPGKEIWSSNDSGGGLNNFYVLIEYGSGASAATQCCVAITVGWGQDGAGNLTGTTSTRTLFYIATGSATLGTCYGSVSSGSIRCTMGTTVSNAQFSFSIERLRQSGSYIDKVNIAGSQGSSTCNFQTCKSTLAYTSVGYQPSNFYPAFTTSSNIQETIVCLGWSFPFHNGWGNKLLNFLMVPSGQLGAPGTTVSITIGGASHTYMIVTTGAGNGLHNSANHNALILYE